jgi:hypothetical protein
MEGGIKTGNQHLMRKVRSKGSSKLTATHQATFPIQPPDFSSNDEEKKVTLVRAWEIRRCEPENCRSTTLIWAFGQAVPQG